MTQIEPGRQTVTPTSQTPPQAPSRTSVRDRLFYGLIAALLLAAAAILGYTALRPVQTPAAPGPIPSVDTRAADEATALETRKKVDAADAVADRNLNVDGSGLEKLVSLSVLEDRRKWYQSLKDEGLTVRGESISTHKVRGYADNPGEVRVIVATCNDVRNMKFIATNGAETPTLGPDGKPADWTFARSELTKQDNGTWLLTSAQVLSGGPSCSLDAPF